MFSPQSNMRLSPSNDGLSGHRVKNKVLTKRESLQCNTINLLFTVYSHTTMLAFFFFFGMFVRGQQQGFLKRRNQNHHHKLGP